jgi:hypothetical protein
MSDNGHNSDDENFEDINDDDYVLDDLDEINEDVEIIQIENIKEENEDGNEDEKIEDEDDESISNPLEKYEGFLPKITELERTKIISELASEISNSRIIIDEKNEKELNCQSGSSKKISEIWFEKRKILKLPLFINRSSQNKIPIQIDTSVLPYRSELTFKDAGF